MDSEEESASEEAEVESEAESDSRVASLALATAYIAKSIFNTEENDSVTNTNGENDSAPTYCFMARGAKLNSRDTYFQTSSEDDSDCEFKPSYKTLAKIATEQQRAMEHTQKPFDKSDDLLDAEMTHS